MRFSPLLLALLPATALAAPLPWTGTQTLGSGTNPAEVRSGDLNGDGWADVVVTYNGATGTVAHLSDGSGGFTTQAAVNATASQGLHIADLEGTGSLDVVVGTPGSDTFQVWSGVGDGAPTSILTRTGSVAITSFDADVDGDLDVYALSQSQAAGFEGVYQIGQIDPGWNGSLIALEASEDWYDLDSGDWDRDGDPDLVVVRESGVFIHTNNRGDTTDSNQDWVSATTVTNLNGVKDVAVGDMDGDTIVDLVLASDASGAGDKIAFWNGDGNGGFSVGEVIYSGADTFSDVALADVDVDGDLDVLAAGPLGIDLFINDAGSFERTTVSTAYTDAVEARFVDLDRDGDLDVVAISDASNDLVWFENLSLHRQVTWDAITSITTSQDDSSGPGLGDLDGDGDLDLLGGENPSGNSPYKFWRENLGNGAAWGPEQTVVSNTNQNQVSYAVDTDNDGDLDYFSVANLNKQQVAQNDGAGNFAAAEIITSSSDTTRQVAFGDVNEDGFVDYLHGRNNGGQLRLELNGDGDASNFTQCNIATFSSHATNDVMLGDVDGDGDLDAFAAVNNNQSSGDAGIYWYEHTPDGSTCGSWSQVAINVPNTQSNNGDIHLGDMDGDGDLDVIASHGTGLYWYENPGAPTDVGGNWTGTPISTVAEVGVHLVDIDLDGDLDVVSGDNSNNTGSIQSYINADGIGLTWTTVQSGSIDSPRRAVLGDLNVDGKLDVLYKQDGGYGWVAGAHQQISIAAGDEAPSSIEEDDGAVVLSITVDHTLSGTLNDEAVELGTVELFLHDGAGVGMTASELEDLYSSIAIYADTDDDGDVTVADTMLDAIFDFSAVSGGVLSITVPTVLGGEVDAGQVGTWLIQANIADTAIAAGLSTAGVDLLASDGILVEVEDTDAPVLLDGGVAGVSGVSFDIDPLDSDDDGDPDTSDCDDADPTIFTGATEICDAVDQDCDGQVDDGFDTDSDGVTTCGPDGVVSTADDDCDDGAATTFPGASESCNAADDDCDGATDEGFDTDGDGVTTCGPDGVASTADDDCDDGSSSAFPGANESCDFIDSDCDLDLVDGFTNTDGDSLPDCVDSDDDGDGDPDSTDCSDLDATIYNGAPESCDSVDSDCDGSLVDEFTNTDGDVNPDCVDTDDDGDSLPDTWEDDNGLDPLDASDASSDADADGRPATQEYADGTDPNVYDGPGAPTNASPDDGVFVTTENPTLEITNATHPLGDSLSYVFEVYSDEALTTLVTSSTAVAGALPTTTWTVDVDLPEDADYWWRAAAMDAWTTGAFSAVTSFTVDTTGESPSVPTPVFPLTGVTMDSGEEELTVEGSTSPEGLEVRYEFEVYDGAAETLVTDGETDGGLDGDTTTWPIDVALSTGLLYQWRARAVDPAGRASDWSELQRFGYLTANSDPTQPLFVSPAEGGDVGTVQPELVFDESIDPEGSLVLHTIDLDTSPDFVSADAVELTALGDGSGTLRVDLADEGVTLTANVTWYGRVQGLDANGQTSPEDTVSFLVRGDNDPPPTPEPLTPAESIVVDSNPVLTASEVVDPEGDAVLYQFQVARTADFAAVEVRTDAATEPRFGIAEDLANGYYWRVRAVDDLGAASEWSTPRWFVAEDPTWGTCSAAGTGAPGALWWLLLPLGFVLRRRRAQAA